MRTYHILFVVQMNSVQYMVWDVKDKDKPDIGPLVTNTIALYGGGKSPEQIIGETILKYRPVSLNYVI